jgi:hypothetical protein
MDLPEKWIYQINGFAKLPIQVGRIPPKIIHLLVTDGKSSFLCKLHFCIVSYSGCNGAVHLKM